MTLRLLLSYQRLGLNVLHSLNALFLLFILLSNVISVLFYMVNVALTQVDIFREYDLDSVLFIILDRKDTRFVVFKTKR